MTLPPLPVSAANFYPGVSSNEWVPGYTPAQMRDYARAAIAAHVPEAGCENIAAVPASLTDEQIIDLWAPMLADGVDRRPVGGRNKIVAFARAVLAAVPAQPVAWMMTPNKRSHRLLMPSVQFEKPVVRADWELTPLYAAPQAVPVPADMALTDDPWRKLYRRAINEANGLTNYVEDRPELRGAERRLAAIEAEARTLAATFEPTPEKKP